MPETQVTRRAARGFTLIEIMVVVVIIALLDNLIQNGFHTRSSYFPK